MSQLTTLDCGHESTAIPPPPACLSICQIAQYSRWRSLGSIPLLVGMQAQAALLGAKDSVTPVRGIHTPR